MENRHFSVILISKNRPFEVIRCLNSIQNSLNFVNKLRGASSNSSKFEILLILNGCKLDQNKFKTYISQSLKENLRALHLKTALSPSGARNFALTQAEGDWVFFCDDDAWVPKEYFKKVFSFISSHPNALIFGGPDQTHLGATSFQKSVGRVLSSFSATGPTRFRHKISQRTHNQCDEKKLILCNLWMKKSLFRGPNGSFPQKFQRNEENFLLDSWKHLSLETYHVPELFLFHERRKDILAFSKQQFQSGEGRMRMNLKSPKNIKAVFFTPFLFMAALFLLTSSGNFRGAVTITSLYFFTIFFDGLILRNFSPVNFLLVPLTHLSYSLGMVCEVFRSLFVKILETEGTPLTHE